jgi:hypothetical protein
MSHIPEAPMASGSLIITTPEPPHLLLSVPLPPTAPAPPPPPPPKKDNRDSLIAEPPYFLELDLLRVCFQFQQHLIGYLLRHLNRHNLLHQSVPPPPPPPPADVIELKLNLSLYYLLVAIWLMCSTCSTCSYSYWIRRIA